MFVTSEKEKPNAEKYKRLKLGGGQAYEHSSNQAAVVTSYMSQAMICYAKPRLTEALYILYIHMYYNYM
jgi:hypothetical protein